MAYQINTWIRPECNKPIKAIPHPDISNAISNLYGSDALLAVLREIGSNSFSHGNASFSKIDWDNIMRRLIISDDGIGCLPQNEKYFYRQDYGEGGQDIHNTNHWRLGMASIALIADSDIITIRNKNEIIVIRWYGQDLREIQTLSISPNKNGNTGITHELQIKPDENITVERIVEVSKKLWFFRILNEKRKVFVNGTEIDYPELLHPETFCDGTGETPNQYIHSLSLNSKRGTIKGMIFINVQNVRPSWLPDKNFMVLYYKNDYRLEQREFFGNFHSILLVNTDDEEIEEKANAGKMEIRAYRTTDFYGLLHNYIDDNFAIKEPTSTELQDYFDNLMQFFPLSNVLPTNLGVNAGNKKHRKRYNWNKDNVDFGKILPPITTHYSSFDVRPIADKTMPFLFASIDANRLILQVNIVEDAKEGFAYPLLTDKFKDLKGNYQDWFTYIARIKRSLQQGVNDFFTNENRNNEEWALDDRNTEDALRLQKKKKTKKDEED